MAQSARSVSTGNASAALSDERAVYHNTAGLSWNEGIYISSNVLNHHFMKELTTKNMAASATSKGNSVSVTFSGSGDERMKISQAATSYGKKFGNTFSMSVSAHWLKMAFGDIYGSRDIIYPAFGFLARTGKSGMIGFHISNPGRQFIRKNRDERFNSRFSTSYRHDFSRIFQWHLEVEKPSAGEASLKSGIIYQALKNTEMCFGLEFPYRRAGLGLGIKFREFKLDLAISCQLETGFRMAIGFIYKIDG